MRFGFHTILWGSRPRDFRKMFECIRENGFRGVEIAQPRDYLPKPEVLRQLLEDYDLTLLSLCGGKLKDRIGYCREARIEPAYYYVEHLDEETARQSCRIALHPHAYTELMQLEKMHKELEDNHDTWFLPDTAHLYVAHVNFVSAIDPYIDRLAAVHLKDWSSIYGRSYQRYARGFCQLGEGEVHPENVLKYLQERSYAGWIVAECDYSKSTPENYAKGAAEWLRRNNVELSSRLKSSEQNSALDGRPIWLTDKEEVNEDSTRNNFSWCSDKKGDCLYRSLFQQLRKDTLADFGRGVLESISSHLGRIENAQLWEFSPTNSILGLLADLPEGIIKQEHFTLETAECLGGETIALRTVTRLDPLNPPLGRTLICEEILKTGNCREIIIVPIFNSCNPNQVELVLSLGVKEPLDEILDEQFLDISEGISLIYETALDDLCMTAASSIEQNLAAKKLYKSYLEAAVKRIQELMHCDGVSLFLPDQADKRLYCEASTGIQWDAPLDQQFYEHKDGSWTAKVWDSNEPYIYKSDLEHRPKSQEIVGQQYKKILLILPLRDAQGKSVGVLRCRNRTEHRQMFAESDLALADTICHAMLPNLLTLRQSDRFRKTIDRMIHELKMPLTAIRGANEVMDWEMKQRSLKFAYDYIGDVASWLYVQEQQIRRVDFYRYNIAGRTDELRPNTQGVWMLRDVVAPACQHIQPLLRERGFSSKRITNDGMYHIPELYLDKAMFQQVFFNLLGNAIKYCYKDPNSFQVDIRTARDDSGFLIIFEDNGLGIENGYEKVIFYPYVRAPGAEKYDVGGDGLGLWVVRDIILAHGGKIKVTNSRFPTQITISLPRKLQLPNWFEND